MAELISKVVLDRDEKHIIKEARKNVGLLEQIDPEYGSSVPGDRGSRGSFARGRQPSCIVRSYLLSCRAWDYQSLAKLSR